MLSVSVLCPWFLWKSQGNLQEKKKINLSECKVYTRLWEVCNDKKIYFFPDPVNIAELCNIQYWNVRGSNRGKGCMVILHC